MFGVDTTQTGTPRRPRLRAMERPFRFPPTTTAPANSVIEAFSQIVLAIAPDAFSVSILGPRQFKFGDTGFVNPSTVKSGFARDEAEQFAGGIMGTHDELHQWAKTPDGRRAQYVQPGNGCLKSGGEMRVSVDAMNGFGKFR